MCGFLVDELCVPASVSRGCHHLLAGDVVGYGKRSAAFGAAACQYFAAIFSGHSLAEAVFVHATAVGGLECSFHRVWLFVIFWIESGRDALTR